MNAVNKRARRGVRMMKWVVNSEEKKLADRELRRRIKELDRERLILVSMEQISRVKRLLAARSNVTETGTESEEDIIREIRRGRRPRKVKD